MNMDFRLFDHRDDQVKGLTFYNGKKSRILIFLHHHETLEDIYASITHELIHYCIDKHSMVKLDEYQEHDAIFKVIWADEYLV